MNIKVLKGLEKSYSIEVSGLHYEKALDILISKYYMYQHFQTDMYAGIEKTQSELVYIQIFQDKIIFNINEKIKDEFIKLLKNITS